MANVFLNARESTKVKAPVASATVIEVGDLVYHDSGNNDVRPASSQTDNVGEEDNQAEFARNFAGVALHASASGDTDDVLVETSLTKEYSVTVPSGTYRLGDLLGASENSDGDGLEDQQLEAVGSEDIAVAIVTDDNSSSRSSVKCRFIRSKFQPALTARREVSRSTLTTDLTLTFDSKRVQSLDPGGSGRTITLPANEESSGLEFEIINRADMAEDLTVQDAGSNTIVTISQNEKGHVIHDGTAWFGGVQAQT